MKKPLVLPKFKDEDEEREYWDKVDITDYFEPSDFKRVIFPNLKRTNKLISIRLPEPLIAEAKEKAGKLNVPYQKLMREILQHGIRAIKTA
jgi:predicted DNA binding CopG/RHH family protein